MTDESINWQRKYDRAVLLLADRHAEMIRECSRADLAIRRANLKAATAKEKYQDALDRVEALSCEMRYNPKIKWEEVAAARGAELH